VADVDRLMQIDKLARLSQPVEELAEVFFHFQVSRRGPTNGRNLLIAAWRGNTRDGMPDVFRSLDHTRGVIAGLDPAIHAKPHQPQFLRSFLRAALMDRRAIHQAWR
jgi:hypothetical protein